jgi:hypothetical protein
MPTEDDAKAAARQGAPRSPFFFDEHDITAHR